MALPAAERAFAEAVRSFRSGDHAAALRLTAEAVELDPAYAEASLELSRLLLAAQRIDDAERVLRRALAATPEHFGLLTNLGALLCQSQRAGEGVQWLERAAAAQPEMALAHYNLANAYKATGQRETAVEHYRRAIARDPHYASAYSNLGNTLAELDRPAEAAEAYQRATDLRRAPGAAASGESFTRTSAGKLRHDIEQIEYLLQHGQIDAKYERVLKDYRRVASALPAASGGTHIVDMPRELREIVAPTYNRLWHRYEAPAQPGGALARLYREAIEADYARNVPGITTVDNFLTPAALAELRRFCLESTVWYQFKYANGYLGAYWEEGFWCPLLAQITEELRLALPGIFRNTRLRKCWAFKYDSRLSGIPVHADFAAVNVNFWITPDEANLDPAHGGLVVWDKEAPQDWSFRDYNVDARKMREFIAESGAKPHTIPHRQNRMAIFNSDLLHETDKIAFKDGYENRRINITLLYGVRGE